ncbi:MAG: exodeoxyribonuclease VII large subunit [Gammaproteobacteria bacterium]|jgi:exodeoxyribonuclease VII large subunit|nr:exodeoxyribonuclease VII large subunit [Gammaproteobacteria bacterium]MBT3723785.1 exodeoxyribonuclease VII large subunit [Gammaproteobacteria bacterium]MBT4075013.1 exodeoxyribonuclease VII large subunit [Gammaproteobacteria bacterium]MBT4196421.1 exodeoxyribonuclease VII large subunit [Gammaproteobacteria bacterium]MBT4448158.1 exodeoxyribonuclease VII large subunit [Gammaproteobacteria bacterium]
MQINEAIWSVSALNFEIKTMLEKGIGSIWIEGEISNLAKPASGHWYFSIKDERAQLRAAMFKNRNGRVAFRPENGQQVLIRAQVTLYEARGDFQVIVDHMEEAGVGRLMQQYEALKKQLSSEGLFATDQKKKIPAQARHIGLITSASGAAIRDALSVIERRSPSSEVTVYPTPVQGEPATAQIIQAIESANRHAQCDVLLLIRGGGSLEDLWCFNEESVARAIFDSEIPVVTGIGHEIDFTIADFVADVRAPTPSVAAETVTMDQFEIMTQLDILSARLTTQMQSLLQSKADSLLNSKERILSFHPERSMDNLKQRLIFAQSRLKAIQANRLQQNQNKFHLAFEQLKHHNPESNIPLLTNQLNNLNHQLIQSMNNRMEDCHHQFSLLATTMDNLSPLKTLTRGYAAISKNKQIISSASQLKQNDIINIRFKDGETKAKVQ